MNSLPSLKTCWQDYSNNFFALLDRNVDNTGRGLFRSGSDHEFRSPSAYATRRHSPDARPGDHARPMRRIIRREKVVLPVGDTYGRNSLATDLTLTTTIRTQR